LLIAFFHDKVEEKVYNLQKKEMEYYKEQGNPE